MDKLDFCLYITGLVQQTDLQIYNTNKMIFVISLFKQIVMTDHVELGTVLSAENSVIRKTNMVPSSLISQPNEGYTCN